MIPKIIKTRAEYDATMARVEQLFDAKPDTARGNELELLLLLVDQYESEQFPIDLPDAITAIRFRMDQQNLKPKDLVPYVGNKSKVSEVLNGQRELSLTMIRNLVNGLGIPAEVLLQKPGSKLIFSGLMDVGADFPLAEMHKRGWFGDTVNSLKDLRAQLQDVLARFAAPLGRSEVILALNRQRTRHGSLTDQPALMAWRIRVMTQALRETISLYRPGIVTTGFLHDVAKLSYFDNGPLLAKEFLNKNGIHLIVERHLPKTFLDGAAVRLPDDTRLVALTLRHDRLDNFWFTLLHELVHISLHLDDSEGEMIFDDLDNASLEAWEQEADALAGEALIPAQEWERAGFEDDYSEERVKSFAKRLRINPAIPAGRIRYERNNYRLLNDLVGSGCVREMFETNS